MKVKEKEIFFKNLSKKVVFEFKLITCVDNNLCVCVCVFDLFVICCRKIFIGGLARETTDG